MEEIFSLMKNLEENTVRREEKVEPEEAAGVQVTLCWYTALQQVWLWFIGQYVYIQFQIEILADESLTIEILFNPRKDGGEDEEGREVELIVLKWSHGQKLTIILMPRDFNVDYWSMDGWNDRNCP